MIKNRVAVSMALVFFIFLFAACAAVKYETPVLAGPKRMIETKYEINKQHKAYAGDKIMEARDYFATVTIHKKMKALNNFKIEGPGVTYSGSKGDLYNVIITTDLNTQPFSFIEIPGVFRRYGIDQEGLWTNLYFFEGHALKARTPITPKDAKFEPVVETKIKEVDASKPYHCFEIIYVGKSQDAIHLLYREFAPDNIERTEFQKKLSYPVDTEILRHGQITIKVHEVTAESISYTVLEDGMSG